jgi:hypothetical protein
VAEENRIKFEALKQKRLAEAKAKREASGQGGANTAVEANQQDRQYQNIFAPTNLGNQVDSADQATSSTEAAVGANQQDRQYQNIFAPTNLGNQVDSADQATSSTEAAVEANQQDRQYQNIFAPTNLGNQVDSASEKD